VVVVVQHRQLAEAQVAGEARRLRGDALLEVAVRRDDVGPVVHDLVVALVELAREAPLGDRHADRVREALAERASGGLDTRGEPAFREAGRARAPQPELHELLEHEAVAGHMEQRVQEHRGVPRRQHEAVTVRPIRVRRGVPEEAGPEHIGHRCRAHRRTRVAGVGLLDGVHREGPDRVDRQLVDLGRHRTRIVPTHPAIDLEPVPASLPSTL
jgi:hypothetical protein